MDARPLGPLPPPPPGEGRPPRGGLRLVLWPALLLAGGLGLTLLILVQLKTTLLPLWAAATAAVLLWPVRRTRAGRAVLAAVALLVGAYLLRQVGGVLAPFVVAFVLAYILDPAVDWARARWGWPRWASALMLTLAVGAVLAGAVVFLVPALVRQAEALIAGAVALAQQAPAWVARSPALDSLERAGLIDRATLVAEVSAYAQAQAQVLAGRLPALALALSRQVGALIGLVMTLAIFPVVLYYLLRDFPAVQRALVSVLPRVRGRREYLARAGHVFGRYLRGQLTISAISAVLVAVPLTLFGVPFSLLLGLMTGVLNLIPTLGAILTYVLGTLLMLIFGSPADVVIVLAVLVGQALVEQAVLTPNIMGQSVGLHPVIIMVSLFVAGTLFGFLGLLLAVPATALLAGALRARREALVLEFGDDAPPDAPPPDAPPA